MECLKEDNNKIVLHRENVPEDEAEARKHSYEVKMIDRNKSAIGNTAIF